MKYRYLRNWLARIANRNTAELPIFRCFGCLPAKWSICAMGLAPCGITCKGWTLYGARVVRDAVWSSHPQLKASPTLCETP
jgi:hypothetical protein